MPEQAFLPAALTEDQYDEVRHEESRLLPGVRALRDRLGLAGAPLSRFGGGSLPVYAVGDHLVLKLYPPVYAGERDLESRVLEAVEGRLPVPTPRVEHVGEADGWGYVLMERLHGESLVTAWPRIRAEHRPRLAAELGETLAALHAVSSPFTAAMEPRDWGAFVAGQRVRCAETQRAQGLAAPWLEQIPDFLARPGLFGPPPPRLGLLHTEVMREHLLVTPTGDGWTLTGLFDFEPAMRGAVEYEFAAVGLYVSRGDGGFLRRVLTAYGFPAGDLGGRGDPGDPGELPLRFLAYALLHVYSNLPRYLRQLPPPAEPTLDALAARWWGVGTAAPARA